jgi:ribonuclease HI
LLTWDVLCRRGWVGPNRCALCFVQGETTPHIFFHCSFTSRVWELVSQKVGIPLIHLDENLEEWLDAWCKDSDCKLVASLPSIVVYFIWWVRNMYIFQNKSIPTEVVVEIIYQMVIFYKKDPEKKKRRIPTMPELIEETPWGFFDGTSQGHPLVCGVGAVLYINENHHFEVCYTPGRGSNMKAELTAIWALVFLTISLNLRKLQIFGDSQVVVDWINGKTHIQVARLQPVMNMIREMLGELEWYSCSHVYRELNQKVDQLSKEALEMEFGAFFYQEFQNNLPVHDMSFDL